MVQLSGFCFAQRTLQNPTLLLKAQAKAFRFKEVLHDRYM